MYLLILFSLVFLAPTTALSIKVGNGIWQGCVWDGPRDGGDVTDAPRSTQRVFEKKEPLQIKDHVIIQGGETGEVHSLVEGKP